MKLRTIAILGLVSLLGCEEESPVKVAHNPHPTVEESRIQRTYKIYPKRQCIFNPPFSDLPKIYAFDLDGDGTYDEAIMTHAVLSPSDILSRSYMFFDDKTRHFVSARVDPDRTVYTDLRNTKVMTPEDERRLDSICTEP